MDKHKIPYDVIWLDIEYTDNKKYFTWDPHTFADPIGMQKQLEAHDRKLVAIIDPPIKKEDGYRINDELKSKDLAIKNKDQQIYDGWCWPGSSHWIDSFNPAAITWWQGLFSYSSWTGTTPNTFLWNDMNEPSVFNGPETTMPKDNLHHDNWEHRDVHNLYGLTYHYATYNALLHRDPKSPRRPFVLTRSFFAGSQHFSTM
ncbi:MAG: Glucosidase 2 subunit alpha [Lasallia pustulata]|uniref:alpha-glucosidase n=1 Tax=Lasallia pustulata TaxID=136370 RepID=A0A5M8PU08_9LECA|nr:MAG: Glucosidase 2 subunit alpha [Lasallia pustulata]